MRIAAILICLVLCTFGCTPLHQPLSRSQWLDLTTQRYSGVTKEQLISAAEEVLTLADGRDFNFAHDEAGFTASRQWMLYMIIASAAGTDVWRFSVHEEKDETLRAQLQISSMSSSVVPYQVIGGNSIGAFTTPAMSAPVKGTSTYKLFWYRLDYILGLSNFWFDCDLAFRLPKTDKWWGTLDPICCPANIKDIRPKPSDRKLCEGVKKISRPL